MSILDWQNETEAWNKGMKCPSIEDEAESGVNHPRIEEERSPR